MDVMSAMLIEGGGLIATLTRDSCYDKERRGGAYRLRGNLGESLGYF